MATILVNNFVLVHFLGLCPFMGVTRKIESTLGMGIATTFVLTLASGVSHIVHHYILVPFDVEFLRIISFIFIIAIIVQFTELLIRKQSPLLHQLLGLYLPLITSNCAVLGVALLSVNRQQSFLEAIVFGFGAAAGFTLVMVLFTLLRLRIEASDVPKPFKGNPIALITAGLMSLAFMGFSGIA
ncbi:MAG: electron transport complex subunit RsxA [Gammaproteobacteria bacterium]|nr:electron transport complex subunit RsxA [Gammaproteobacteria bacterium]